MPKFSVDIRYPIKGFECYELEIEASSEEEAKEKAIEFVQTGEVEGVASPEDQPFYDDMQTYCEGFRPCEYDVETREI
jgi:hypothetical protein